MAELRDRRLYRSTHKTFEEYCKDRFGSERRHPYKLIEASAVFDNLMKMRPIGTQMEVELRDEQMYPNGTQMEVELENEQMCPNRSQMQLISDRIRSDCWVSLRSTQLQLKFSTTFDFVTLQMYGVFSKIK